MATKCCEGIAPNWNNIRAIHDIEFMTGNIAYNPLLSYGVRDQE